MENYQKFCTVLNAIQYILTQDVGLEHSDKIALGHMFEKVSSGMSDLIFKATE